MNVGVDRYKKILFREYAVLRIILISAKRTQLTPITTISIHIGAFFVPSAIAFTSFYPRRYIIRTKNVWLTTNWMSPFCFTSHGAVGSTCKIFIALIVILDRFYFEEALWCFDILTIETSTSFSPKKCFILWHRFSEQVQKCCDGLNFTPIEYCVLIHAGNFTVPKYCTT